MSKPIKKKICIVTVSLGGGGAERSAGLLSKMLDNLGYDVHIVTAVNDIDYPFSGKLLNLGLIKEKHSKLVGSVKRFSKLYYYLREHNFDYIIDSRTRVSRLQEVFVSKLLYRASRTIYYVHSFLISNYLPSNKFLARWCYGNSHKIIGVSKVISEKLIDTYRFDNVLTIHNPILKTSGTIENKPVNQNNYILFFGRLEDSVKNISLLLESYAKSALPDNQIELIIMGDGKDKLMLKRKVDTMSCRNCIRFIDFNSQPEDMIFNAKATVLTSKHEGFPMMILESLALGIPVISVNCESGPSELITNGENGLLVENHNPEALSKAMNELLFNNLLYKKCKSNAKDSVAKYSLDVIAKKWQQILT